MTACSSPPGDAWLSAATHTVSRTHAAPACEAVLREAVVTRATPAPTGLEVRRQRDGFSSSPPVVLQSRRGRPPAWGRSCATGPCGQQLLSTKSGPTPSLERRPGHARPMAFHDALRARRDRAARYWFGRAAREVSRARGARSGERAVDVITPGPPGRARSTLRATLRVAPAAPSSRSASGGLCLLVPRPVRQLSVGASRAVSSRPDQDPSALRALRCGSTLGPVVPRRRSRPLSRALCRTGRGNGWQDTCSAVPPVPASAPVPGGSR